MSNYSQRYITGPLGKQSRPCVIALNHLAAQSQGHLALSDISLSIYEGESIAILGTAGAGKSLLLASLQGLVQPTQGHIAVLGATLPPIRPETRQQIGAMPVYLDIGTHLTVGSYLRHWATYYDIQLSATQADEYLCPYGLTSMLSLAHLTPLQRRILQLALALVHDPRIVLLDEPLRGLTAEDHEVVWHHLRRMQSEGRTSLATFTLPLAQEHRNEYDLIVRLDHGHIVQ